MIERGEVIRKEGPREGRIIREDGMHKEEEEDGERRKPRVHLYLTCMILAGWMDGLRVEEEVEEVEDEEDMVIRLID